LLNYVISRIGSCPGSPEEIGRLSLGGIRYVYTIDMETRASVKRICAHLSIIYVTYTIDQCAHMRKTESSPGPLIEVVETRVEWEADNSNNFFLRLSKPIRPPPKP